jgi:hypothetical protein
MQNKCSSRRLRHHAGLSLLRECMVTALGDVQWKVSLRYARICSSKTEG